MNKWGFLAEWGWVLRNHLHCVVLNLSWQKPLLMGPCSLGGLGRRLAKQNRGQGNRLSMDLPRGVTWKYVGLSSPTGYQPLWAVVGGAARACWSTPCVCAWCNVCTPQFPRLQLWPQFHSPEQGVREAGSALLPKLGLGQQVLSGSVLYDHFQVVGQVRERERCGSEWHEEPAGA